MNCEQFLLSCEDKMKFQKNFESIDIYKIITESQLKEIVSPEFLLVLLKLLFRLFKVNQNCN